VPFARIPRLSVIAAISVAGSMVAMETEPSAECRKEVGLTCQVSRPRERAFCGIVHSRALLALFGPRRFGGGPYAIEVAYPLG
jgi:hypothetical protein